MNEIPSIWLWLSGLFFFFGTVFFAVLSYVLLQMKKQMDEMRPKVDDLSHKLSETITQVQEVAKRVDEVAKVVAKNTEEVSNRAKGVMGSAELIAQSASRQFEKFSPLIVGAMTAARLLNIVRDVRGGGQPTATPTGNVKSSPKPVKRKGVMGLLRRN